MKKLLTFAITALLLFGCKQEIKTDYVINGTAKGVYNGIRVYLNKMNDKGRLTPTDTAIIMNNTFTFTGKADTPTLRYITVNSINGRLPIMLENNTITINIDKDKFINSEITGSKSHNEMEVFTKKTQSLSAKIKELTLSIRNTGSIKDKRFITETQSKLKTLKAELRISIRKLLIHLDPSFINDMAIFKPAPIPQSPLPDILTRRDISPEQALEVIRKHIDGEPPAHEKTRPRVIKHAVITIAAITALALAYCKRERPG